MKRLALLLVCFSTTALATSLPATVQSALKNAQIPLDAVGIEVREIGTHAPRISIHATRPMNPASTMKLLTTYAGLELLGPAYTWRTEAWLDGELKDGVLNGNLVLKGYGDPKFTIEQFWLWLAELQARGLKDIRGDLVLDRTFFDLPAHDPGEFDNDPVRAYNVGPDALLINFNTLLLRYQPDAGQLRLSSEPALQGITLENQLAPLTGDSCADWDDTINVQPHGDSILFQGGYPAHCGEREHNLNLLPHTRYVDALFRTLWQELGGTLQGAARDGTTPDNARLFSTHASTPLSEVIRDINKFSNNVMARQLFLTLGTARTMPPLLEGDAAHPNHSSPVLLSSANLDRSTVALRAWLNGKRLQFPELVLENGAGLSRKERISATHMAQLLQAANASPMSAELTASLPILGIDGSVKNRLKDSPAASHAHLKTGTLDGVKTVAGYVRSRSGREWVVVFFINHRYAQRGTDAQDALIEWVQSR